MESLPEPEEEHGLLKLPGLTAHFFGVGCQRFSACRVLLDGVVQLARDLFQM